MYAGVSAHEYRLTLITYTKPTFFRSSNVSSADSVDDLKRPITSSIVGFSWAGITYFFELKARINFKILYFLFEKMNVKSC